VLFVNAFTPNAVLLVDALLEAADNPNEVLVVPIFPAAVLLLRNATSTASVVPMKLVVPDRLALPVVFHEVLVVVWSWTHLAPSQ
jgi:hypothetical protein